MRVTILGCGGSSGTPAIDDRGGGGCDPSNPRNRRSRPSIMVEEGDVRILVDTSPDLRTQLLQVGVNRLDAVVYTHGHADHMNGIDDLRAINRTIKAPLDIYADAPTLASIKERFGYVFEPLAENAAVYYKPVLIPHEIKGGDRLDIGGVDVAVFRQDHTYCHTMGFRFGPVAYSTDTVEMSEAAFAMLEGVEVWIVGALSMKPHPTHAHVGKALEWIERVKPRLAVLTHLDVYLDYDELSGKLPDGVKAGFDGMVIEA